MEHFQNVLLISTSVIVPRKAMVFKHQKKQRLEFIITTTKRSACYDLEIYPQKRFNFLQAKGHARYKFRALDSHLLMHLENKGRRQEKNKRQPSPLRCLTGLSVCISWCIFRTILKIKMGVSDLKKTGMILSHCFCSTLNYCKIRDLLTHDVKL